MKQINHQQLLQDTVKKALGHYLTLSNNLAILDFSLGSGTNIFGHSFEPVVQAAQNAFARAQVHGCVDQSLESTLHKLTAILPTHLETVVFSSSGTEATQRALRYARQISGKDTIAHFAGHWHGMNEWTLVDNGSRFAFELNNTGVVSAALDKYRTTIEYDNLSDLQQHLVERNVGSLIIEAIPGASPLPKTIQILADVIKLCKELKIVTIVDEIISGFRVNLNGVCGTYDLLPDIITYGKVIGGGLPIGITCLSQEAVSLLNADSRLTVLSGGTFSAAPLVIEVMDCVIDNLMNFDYKSLDGHADELRKRVNLLANKAGVPLRAVGSHSISRLAFTDKEFLSRKSREALESANHDVLYDLKNRLLHKHQIYIPKNGLIFLCAKTTESEINKLVDAIRIELECLPS